MLRQDRLLHSLMGHVRIWYGLPGTRHREGAKVAQNRTEAARPAHSVRQPIGDEWVVVMEWPDGVEDGGPGKLTIEPVGDMPVGGLSSTVLRLIDFREATADLRRQVAASRRRGRSHAAYEKSQVERLRAALAEGVTDEYLSLLSSAYVRAVKRGQAKVNDHLAEMVGKPVSTVRGHLWQARNDGFLTRSPGRKGGQLTPKAIKVLERVVPRDWESPLETLDRLRASET
ncbi:hypothetical protein ACKUUI_05960 [Mycobacterium seoulense]|uniref:hypothetical protein n=1 Tax=Mycobacterium seoulense TaxID=386911 RepID=UPI003CEDED6D